MTETPNLPRTNMLFAWANHLINEKLGHDNFDFNSYHKSSSCGTFGCAIGELPYVFPDTFEFSNVEVCLVYNHRENVDIACNETMVNTFNLNESEANTLYNICHDEGIYCLQSYEITAQMVGNKIFELATELQSKYYSPNV